MAIYKVQAPDGSILKVEGPDDASEKDVLDFAMANWSPDTSAGAGRGKGTKKGDDGKEYYSDAVAAQMRRGQDLAESRVRAERGAGAGRGVTLEDGPDGTPGYNENVVAQLQRASDIRKQRAIDLARQEVAQRGTHTEAAYDPLTGVPYGETQVVDSDPRALDERRTRYDGRLTDADIPGMTPLGLAKDVAAGAAQIPGVLGSGVGQIGRLISGDSVGRDTQQYWDEYSAAVRKKLMSDRGKAQAAMLAQDMEDPAMSAADVVFGNKGAVADQALPQVGSMLPPIAAASLIGKAAMAGNAAKLASAIDPAMMAARVGGAQTLAVGLTAAAQNAAEAYSDIRDKGGSQADAYKGATIAAGATIVANKLTGGGVEAAIAKGTLGKGPDVLAKVGSVALGAAKEFAQEGMEGAGGYIGKQVGTGQPVDAGDLAKTFALEGTMGALMGGGAHGIGAVREAVTGRAEAPKVEDMPTVPVAPEVPPGGAPKPAANGAARSEAAASALGDILAREGLTPEQTAAAAPEVQPGNSPADTAAAAAPAVPEPMQATVERNGKVTPAAYDPVVKLQQELADLKARTDRAIAQNQAAAPQSANFEQASATPAPQPGAAPSPQLVGRMVERAIVNASKNQDLRDARVYPEPVLYGIINAPDVGPELLSAARDELRRRRGLPVSQPISYSTGATTPVSSEPSGALRPPIYAATTGASGSIGRIAGPAAVAPDSVSYQPGAPSAPVDSGARTASTAGLGGRAAAQQPAVGGSGRTAAGAAPVGATPDSGARRLDQLPLADAAPDAAFSAVQQAVYKQKAVVIRRSSKPLNYQQQIVSKAARMMGKTITWIERSEGPARAMPDGFVNRFSGQHIFLDVNSEHPLLEVLMHEGTHALPDRIRAKLKTAVLAQVSPEGQAAFVKRYGYDKNTQDIRDEEVTAYTVQLVARKPEFFQDLRRSLGNKDFAEVARVIISKIKNWMQGQSDFDSSFLDKHVADVKQVHDAAVQAYTDAMREMGVQPDEEVVAPVFAKKDAEGGRVGKVGTHVLAAQRGERVKADKTRVAADEKAIIREAAKKMGVTIAEVEEMVRSNKAAHPAADGWAPLTLTGVKVDEDGKAELQYQTVPYAFNNDSQGSALSYGSPEYVAKVRNMAASMLREVRGVYERAKAGDTAAQKIIAQSGWYKEMRTRLRQEFGGLGDLFADLLGATSPNTPVRTNWDNSIEALRLATRGEFNALLPKWIAWARSVDAINTRFRARYNDMLEAGMTKTAIKRDAEFKWLAEQASQLREFPDELLPLKSNGKKFGFNGKNVVRAVIDLWRVVKNADPDIRLGGTAPKAINFSGNLIGFRFRATIDVWAARMLQRLSGGLRIPSMAEGGVTGEALESGRNTLQFGFGQDVFAEAVKLIRNDSELSQDPTLRSINDDDLQALVWFIEKEVWTKGNWTSAAGEGGSFEFESDLAGVTDRDAVNQQRKIADSSVARSPEQTAAAQAEIERLTQEMENFGAIPAANATLKANADAVANKTAKPADVRAANAAARETIKKAKSSPQYKALVSERDRQKNILKKPTTEQRAQMRADAVQKLEGMARTVDRYTAGLSIQKGAEQGMDPTPPTDAEMAGLIEKVTDAVVQGDPGATIVGLKAIATEGRYGAPERALDLEVITTDEFDPAPMAAGVFSAAQEADQDAAFVARVLRPDEEFDPLMHRPGIELYFRDMNQAAEAARMMAEIPSIRLSKPSEFGPNYFAIGGYTVVVDGRPSAQAQAGAMGRPVGMRVMYLPEFEARYGMDPRLENATDAELVGIVEERADDLAKFADTVLQKFEGVSFAGRFDYEVDTRFAGEYQGAIDAYTNGKSASPDRQADGRAWAGRSNRESIAAATGRLQVDGGEPGAELPGGLDAPAYSNKAGSGRAVEPDVQDGSGARPNSVRVRATHFSQQPRTSLDGRYNGTGLKGAERTRLSLATDPRIKERVYFYVDEGSGIRPESGVGGIAHTADLRNIYDVTGDPQKLFRSGNDNTNESALLDAGYDGYYVPKVFNNQGVVVVLGNASRGIRVEPTEYTRGRRQAEPEPPYKRALMSRELNKLDLPALQAVAPSATLSRGTLQLDRAELDAARDALAGQGIDLPEDSVAFSNKATGERQIGINVRSDIKAGIRYADLLVDGKKAYETRDTDSLRPYVGRTVGIVRTGEGQARAIGSVKIGEPIKVGAAQFRRMQAQHLVPAGSEFDIKRGGEKFLYPVTEAKRFDEEYDVEPGIVGRQIKDAPAFSNKDVDLDQDITMEIPVEGGKTATLTINAQAYLKQLDARESALRMVKECMA